MKVEITTPTQGRERGEDEISYLAPKKTYDLEERDAKNIVASQKGHFPKTKGEKAKADK